MSVRKYFSYRWKRECEIKLYCSLSHKVDIYSQIQLCKTKNFSESNVSTWRIFKWTLNIAVILEISYTDLPRKRGRKRPLGIKTRNALLKDSFASFAPLTRRDGTGRPRFTHRPPTSLFVVSAFDHNHPSGIRASFPGSSRLFIPGYESSVSFSSVAAPVSSLQRLQFTARFAARRRDSFEKSGSFPSFRLYAVYKCRTQAHNKFTIVYPREMKCVPGDSGGEKERTGEGKPPEESSESHV